MHPNSPFLVLVAIVCLVLAAASSAPLTLVLAGIGLWLAVVLLWPPGTLPLCLMPVGFQWLQANLKPIQAALTGRDLMEVSEFGVDLDGASLLAATAIIALAIGMRLGSGRPDWRIAMRAREEIRLFTPRQIYIIAGIAIGFGHFAEAFAGYTGGAYQLVRGLGAAKLCGLFVLTYWSMATGRGRPVLVAVSLFEVGIGFLGFFAEYREALFVIGIGLLAAPQRLKPRSVAVLSLGAAFSIALVVFWTSVKPEYRAFLNFGSGDQVVLRPVEERIDFLLDKAGQFDIEMAKKGLDGMISRIAYIDFLSLSMRYVPSFRPHEWGTQTGEALAHIFQPRILFPDKPPLPHDTDVTTKYTGQTFTAAEVTSISLGWLGELYVDFGVFGALGATVLLGALIARLYLAMISSRKLPALLGAGLGVMPLSCVMMFETALPKLVGAVVMAAIAGSLLQRFGVPALLRFVDAEHVAADANARVSERQGAPRDARGIPHRAR